MLNHGIFVHGFGSVTEEEMVLEGQAQTLIGGMLVVCILIIRISTSGISSPKKSAIKAPMTLSMMRYQAI